ncbi:MAG: hypothetical protein LIP77_00900, partial [Planctomycetes bacterium]|nr:hypothetical protein [Planctomycetota bacterium]
MRLSVMFLVAVTLARSVVAGEDALAERARMLIDYQSFLRGDRDGAVRFAINTSHGLRDTPLAELAMRIALFYDPAVLSSVNVGEAETRRILGTDSSRFSPEYRDLLRRYLARNYAAAGRREEAMEVHRRRGLAMSWLVAGPFYGSRAAIYESRELPEAGELFLEDVVDAPPDAATFREWRRRPPWRVLPENRSFPNIRPWRRTADAGDGAMLMFTALDMAEADNQAAFHVYSETSWRLFVDGALVAEVDRNNRQAPVEHLVPFSLTAGRHSVMLQLFPPGATVAREDVRVWLRLESDTVFSFDRNAATPETVRPTSARREARRLRYLTDLQAAAEAGSPTLMAAYAVALLEQKMPDEAAWWAERAATAAPGDVNLMFMAGLLNSMTPLLPAERRRAIAGAW